MLKYHRFNGFAHLFSYYIFTFSVILSELSLQPTESIDPEPLWTAINETISKGSYQCCEKVILYNEDAESYANKSLYGNEFIAINTDSNTPDGFMTEDLVKVFRSQSMRPRDLTKSQPCILTVSLVNTKRQVVELESSMTPEDLDDRKWKWSLQFAKMLQFRMPLRSRNLLLIRFASSPHEFGHCRKNQPYLKYPRRLVPVWEQVLFDFFLEAKVLLAVDNMKTVPTKKEEADFIWLCEDIMTKLDQEDECKKNITDTCRDQMAKGEYSPLSVNMANCTNHTPRM